MSNVTSYTESMDSEIEAAVTRLLDEYNEYCLSEDADPEAYVERMRYLLEELQTAPERDPVALAALPVFLESVERTEEDYPP